MTAGALRNRPVLDAPPKRLTVEQYHAMIESGTLAEGEPYELLHGQIVHKLRNAPGEDEMTVGPDHPYVVTAIAGRSGEFTTHGCFLMNQQPITLAPLNEPEPDGTIVRGVLRDFRGRKPTADDVLCVIEVADASLRYDRTAKLEAYADAGIGTYIILNVPGRVAEIYTEPRQTEPAYARLETLTEAQTLTLPTADGAGVNVVIRDLLP